MAASSQSVTRSLYSTSQMSGSPQLASSATILPSPQEDEVRSLFREVSRHYFMAGTFKKLDGSTPLIELCQEEIFHLLNYFHGCQSLFFRFFQQQLPEVTAAFVKGLYHFKVHRSTEEIVKFLQRCRDTLKIIGKMDASANDSATLFDCLLKLFETNRLDLFFLSPSTLQGLEPSYTNEEKYRIAVKSYTSVFTVLAATAEVLTAISVKPLGLCRYKSPDVFLHFKQFVQFNRSVLDKNPLLTKAQKVNIHSLLIRVGVDFFDRYKKFASCLKTVISQDIADYYIPIIASQETEKIAAIAEGSMASAEQFNAFDRQYVGKFREVYEGFLPRVEEAYSFLESSIKEMEAYSFFLKNLPLYLQFGDLTALNEGTERSMEKRLKRQMAMFDKLRQEEPLSSNIQAYLKDPARSMVAGMHEYFDTIYTIHRELSILVPSVLSECLNLAKRRQGDLFVLCTVAPAPRRLHPSLPMVVPAVPESIIADPTPSSSSTVEPPVIQVSLTCFDRLKNVYQRLVANHTTLTQKVQSTGTKTALHNAQDHVKDLLSTIHRLRQQPTMILTRQQVHSAVVDFVRHTILAVEQMVLALNRKSNFMGIEEAYEGALTHDIYETLLKCKFPAGPLTSRLRTWIREANYGEILVRDLSQCKFKRSSVHQLLAQTWLYVKGEGTLPASDILRDAVKFCWEGMRVCIELQKQIHKTVIPNANLLGKEMHALFTDLLQEISQNPPMGMHSAEPSSSSDASASSHIPSQKLLDGLYAQIGALQDQFNAYQVDHSLDNVCSHLLLQLDTELNASVNPIQLHLHAGNVFLLNQMILEKVLENLLNVHLGSVTVDEKNNHNLFAMVSALGMTQKNFTLEEYQFLTTGRAVRQVVRYTSNDGPIPKNGYLENIQKAMEVSRSMSRPELFTHDLGLDTGFQVADKEMGKKLNIINEVIRKNVSLLRSILSKVLAQHEILFKQTPKSSITHQKGGDRRKARS